MDNMTNKTPAYVEAECIVLSTFLRSKSIAYDNIGRLVPDDFSDPKNRTIFNALRSLVDSGSATDAVAVRYSIEAMDNKKQFSPIYLNDLVGNASYAFASTSIDYYIGMLKKASTYRAMIAAGERIAQIGCDAAIGTEEAIEAAEQAVGSITRPSEQTAYEHLGSSVDEHLAMLEDMQRSGGAVIGVPTGFKELDRMTTGLRDGDLIIVAGRPGMGKCLGKDTGVLLYDGSVKMSQDIVVGDLLIGPDSRPRKVISTTSGVGNLYRVSPIRGGGDFIVNEEHILSLRPSGLPYKKYGDGRPINMSVKEFLSLGDTAQTKLKGWITGVDWEYRPVSINPYMLGLWLGDGSAGKPEITSADNEVIGFIKSYCSENNLRHSVIKYTNRNCSLIRIAGKVYRQNSFTDGLKKYGCFYDKFIPNDYMINSRDIRLSLLAGIIDTDGSLIRVKRSRKNGCYVKNAYEIVAKSEPLAKQIVRLARSLGFYSRSYKCIKTCTNSSRGRVSGEYNRIYISGNVSCIPLLINRKKILDDNTIKDVTNIRISVTPIGTGEYYGFELDGDGLFLLDSFMVTHNSSLAISIARRAALENYPVGVFSIEMSKGQVLDRMFACEAHVDLHKIRSAMLSLADWRSLEASAGRIKDAPIYIDDTPGISLTDLLFKAKKMKDDLNISLLVVDYAQLISYHISGRAREQEVAHISKSMKGLARSLNIPVILVAQLSRANEQRGESGRRPMLSDLRESGSLEQDADVVLFVYRDDYYKQHTEESDTIVDAEIIIAKQRQGPTGIVTLSFHKAFTDFFSQSYYGKGDDDGISHKDVVDAVDDFFGTGE